jgi:hypothetical protein
MRDYSGVYNRRVWLQALGIAGCVALRTVRADPSAEEDRFLHPAARSAVARALAWLAEQIDPNGSLGSGGYRENVAVCSLAGLTFLASGSTPGRGPWGKAITQLEQYVLACSHENGFLSLPGATSHGPMYDHGFGTLFLAELYGMSPRDEVRTKLAKAVRLIVTSQNTQGGWRYEPRPHEADVSVTICQVMALRAARNAGLHVPSATIERCIDYVKRCQNPDGGFMYMLEAGGPSAFARSAAGVVALYSAGEYEGAAIERGLAYLERTPPQADQAERAPHELYGHYYAVQAMWQAGGEHWDRWYPAIRDLLLARQQENGRWRDNIGDEYATAMATLILQMPNNLLPIFQR